MWFNVRKHFSAHKLFYIAFLIIIAYLLPYYILEENTHIRVHDNLDSNIVWYKMLAESGAIFSSPNATLPNVINGLPRSALASGLDANVWLYVLFSPFTAYTINQTFMRFVAYIGMYILLRKNILNEKSAFITTGVALGYALLPYWPSGSLSIAGLPLALHIFLTIRKQGKHTPKLYWVLLFLFPFYSSFILSFIFFLGLIGLLWLIDWFRSRKFNPAFFFSIAGMTFIYLIKNYMLIVSMFLNSTFTSHREALNLGHKNLPETWDLFLKNFIEGHTHAWDMHATIIFPITIIALVIAVYRKMDYKLLLGLLIANTLFSLFYAFWYWEEMRFLKDSFSIFNTFNFSRIQFMRPVMWYLSFALALTVLWKWKFGKVIVAILIVCQCAILFPLTEEIKYSIIDTPTYKEFYSTNLFQKIEDYIGKDQADYRVVSVAMHPTIAQYNGFYTLDTYNNTFPLAYKHEFRKVIAPELEKNPKLKNYFDTWGSRLYMYVGELGKSYMFSKHSEKSIKELNINTDQLAQLGGEFVFSALPIENAEEIDLTFERSFELEGSPWKIYLYHNDHID
ncbi:DUF6044 family protein [Virgibacillus alimentarius]|uniref:YkoS n=1 Tax=Virgibacillus alimentarius TaxID=698769 RepID=A0ABS4S5G6_9BACI|nr:DUF6044 family protein [Virgibacillus alimentarius]MBP2256742.1 hypothetical protein [Virgibacillus alimentarius]